MNIFLVITTSTVIVLSLCILYLVYSYRKLLEKYTKLSLDADRDEVRKKIKLDVSNLASEKLDTAISQAVNEATLLISKNAKNVTSSMKRKSIEKLIEEERGEEKAIEGEFNQSK